MKEICQLQLALPRKMVKMVVRKEKVKNALAELAEQRPDAKNGIDVEKLGMKLGPLQLGYKGRCSCTRGHQKQKAKGIGNDGVHNI
jgi:hypothetical protein